jgi:16S rRNA (adenine1518-N6/adenine1519-N6)-dimethyltransferase
MIKFGNFVVRIMTLPAKRSLGQNFLVDENILRRIAAESHIRQDDIVVEIGPGTGALTRHLLEYPLRKLIAFEVDHRAVALLQNEITDPRFEVRHMDFLECKLSEIGSDIKMIGNIPYYITSPILFKLVDDRSVIRDALLLIQREVAERLTAQPRTKAYGIPTVIVNVCAEVSNVLKVPASVFRPRPNVDSMLVRIDFQRDHFTRSGSGMSPHYRFEDFRRLVRLSFAMRRKTLRNNLRSAYSAHQMDMIEHSSAAVYLSRRAEELTIEEFLSFNETVSSIVMQSV